MIIEIANKGILAYMLSVDTFGLFESLIHLNMLHLSVSMVTMPSLGTTSSPRTTEQTKSSVRRDNDLLKYRKITL